MALIRAETAKVQTLSYEQRVGALIREWEEDLNKRIQTAAHGDSDKPGATEVLFPMSTFSDLKTDARKSFIRMVKDAGYTITCVGGEEMEEYYVYKISWSHIK